MAAVRSAARRCASSCVDWKSLSGLFDVQCWARDPEEYGQSAERAALPVEDKESRKWLVGYQTTATAQRRLPKTRIVNVADREADDFELFAFARSEKGNPELLVRATKPRKIESADPKTPNLWEYVKSLTCEGTVPLVVPRRGSRPRRETTLEVRFSKVTVRPPKKSRLKSPVKLWAVAVAVAVTVTVTKTESKAPAGIEPLEWLLLTTIPVTNLEEAAEKVSWYALRWRIEVFHRTLKSGCRIEDRQLGTAKSLEACLAVDMVVAWRVFLLTKLGRETPDAPCTVFFEDAEWKALVCFTNKSPREPTVPPTLNQATRMVATLGGFQGRKSDGELGSETLWRGLLRLDDITEATEVFAPWGKARARVTVSSERVVGKGQASDLRGFWKARTLASTFTHSSAGRRAHFHASLAIGLPFPDSFIHSPFATPHPDSSKLKDWDADLARDVGTRPQHSHRVPGSHDRHRASGIRRPARRQGRIEQLVAHCRADDGDRRRRASPYPVGDDSLQGHRRQHRRRSHLRWRDEGRFARRAQGVIGGLVDAQVGRDEHPEAQVGDRHFVQGELR